MLKLEHKNLAVWTKSLAFVKEIYYLTRLLPKEELYVLTSQLRRAAVSIISNIAEGASRKSAQERKRFYEISRSSLVETDTQIEICILLGYLKHDGLKNLHEITNEVFALLSAMINNTR